MPASVHCARLFCHICATEIPPAAPASSAPACRPPHCVSSLDGHGPLSPSLARLSEHISCSFLPPKPLTAPPSGWLLLMKPFLEPPQVDTCMKMACLQAGSSWMLYSATAVFLTLGWLSLWTNVGHVLLTAVKCSFFTSPSAHSCVAATWLKTVDSVSSRQQAEASRLHAAHRRQFPPHWGMP